MRRPYQGRQSAANRRRARYDRAVRAALIAFLMLTSTAAAEEIPLPRGTRPSERGTFLSSQPFRDTVDHLRRTLTRRGIAFDTVGPYRRRGVTVLRLLPRRADVPVIHIWTTGGRTSIFLVPPAVLGQPLDRPAPPR